MNQEKHVGKMEKKVLGDTIAQLRLFEVTS